MTEVEPGAASLDLLSGVLLLNEDATVFVAMLDGWTSQMIGGRRLQKHTVSNRIQVIRQFQRHAGEWPWAWSSALLDEWMMNLTSTHRLAASTIAGIRTLSGSSATPVLAALWLGGCAAALTPSIICVCT